MKKIVVLFEKPVILPNENKESISIYGLQFLLDADIDNFDECAAGYTKYLTVCQRLYLNNGECRQDDIKEITFTKIDDMELDRNDIIDKWYLTNEEVWRELKDKGEVCHVDVQSYTVSNPAIKYFLTGVSDIDIKLHDC